MKPELIKKNALVVDVRGVLCPVPVIETKKVTDREKTKTVVTIVDNEVSRDNVSKFGKSQNYEVSIEQDGKDFYITLQPQGNNTSSRNGSLVSISDEVTMSSKGIDTMVNATKGKTILITKDYLGEGSTELGRTLMKTFLSVLNDVDHIPSKIYFINSGVTLVTEENQNLDSLKELALKGVEIAACGICLNYFELTEKVKVGSITNMYVISEMILSEETITL